MISSTIKHRVHSFPEIQETSPNRLFVFAESRSGSTWLINTLDTHPEIGLLDEVINPDYAKKLQFGAPIAPNEVSPKALQMIESQLSRLTGRYKGCKILFPQAIRFIDFYEFVLNYRDARFIILTRRNSIRAEISGLIANEHARWHLAENKEVQQISVDPAFLYERLLWRKHSKEFCTNLIKSFCRNIFELEYADLFTGIDASLEKISSFLDITPGAFSYSGEVKSNPFPLKEMVLNYTACVEFFSTKPEFSSSFKTEELMG